MIPSKADYLGAPNPAQDAWPHKRELVTGGEEDPLFQHLVPDLGNATNVDIAVAFAMETGVRLLEEHLRDVLKRGGRVRIVVGDYLGVTQPEALFRLLDLQGIELRIFQSRGVSFHPKAYVIVGKGGQTSAFVGSSNLSRSALLEGVEWNYRISSVSQPDGIKPVLQAFEELFLDPRTISATAEWVNGYKARRKVAPIMDVGVDEPVPDLPTPNSVQQEAMRKLEATRAGGAEAGLVVLATGVGKTWLSAFDSNRPEFRRVLFVAHREEILAQAAKTFRTIRPTATMGFFNGVEKAAGTDIVFASIQTIGKARNLQQFGQKEFDYVIVDEFHHAAASTYRRLIAYLEPKFLLGMTATPERTDGGDLLSLCGENLVYRRDVSECIQRGLLSPYAYFGVPDEVDYSNIPWRGGRFDEEKLTDSVATKARAQNALEQLTKRGGIKTIAFCVSQRHADFMAKFFREKGKRAVAVHSGGTSAPRALSLGQLQAGELDVVCAVDMFNEGVDLPDVDTILMLRPTESRILWLQQFGRGLRLQQGKTLKVIDYIGNHRVFLNKTRALFNLGDSNRDVSFAITRYINNSMELPPGCSVTYDLEAIEILKALSKPRAGAELLEGFYRDFKERIGFRPSALEAFREGYNPRSARQHHSSWLEYVKAMGDFSPEQERIWGGLQDFLRALEATEMTKSYKMVLLSAMLSEDAFPGKIRIERLVQKFSDIARRFAVVRSEVGEALLDDARLRALIETNPINAWVGGRGMGGVSYFAYSDGEFSTTPALKLAVDDKSAASDLIRELVDWRLGEYLARAYVGGNADRIICKVSHSGGKPILFLPDRGSNVGIPESWHECRVDDKQYQAKFAKVAVNVLTVPGSEENELPAILRGWFGPDAGAPGRSDRVIFARDQAGYELRPYAEKDAVAGLEVWKSYKRAEIPKAFGYEFKGWEAQSGVFIRPERIIIFNTLEKQNMPETHRYSDKFISATHFQWQSQNRTSRDSRDGELFKGHKAKNIEVLLMVRRNSSANGKTAPFIYCGKLEFVSWEGDRPITIQWKLEQPVPDALRTQFNVPG